MKCVARFPQFVLVGSCTFALYLVSQTVLAKLGLEPFVALTIAYLIAILFHYTSNRLYTWSWHPRSLDGTLPSVARYAAMTLFSYFVTLIVTRTVTKSGIDIRIGMTLSVLVTTCVSYILQRFWVFSA